MIGCSVSLFLGIVSSCGLWEIIKRMMEEMSGFFFSAVSSLKCLVVGFFCFVVVGWFVLVALHVPNPAGLSYAGTGL